MKKEQQATLNESPVENIEEVIELDDKLPDELDVVISGKITKFRKATLKWFIRFIHNNRCAIFDCEHRELMVGNVEIHHIDPHAFGNPKNDFFNLIPLCGNHHKLSNLGIIPFQDLLILTANALKHYEEDIQLQERYRKENQSTISRRAN